MELEIENQLINSCLRKIEDRLGWGSSITWSTQEFESLSQKIQEATGIALSVATLKRIWGKVQYTSKPNVTTLNALAQYLGHENWQVFKQKNLNDRSNGHATTNPPIHSIAADRKKHFTFLVSIIGVLLIGILILYFYPKTKDKLVDPAQFQFTSKKVVDEGVPNTVIFDYDASNASPEDSVFIQQSWDKRLSTLVDKDQRQHTSIYYHPGFFEAKLRINQTVVKEHNLFITTKGWASMIDIKPVPVYFREEDVNTNGQLGITVEQLQSNNISLQPQPPFVAYYNMRDFDGAMSDDLVVESTFKNSYPEGANACQYTEIRIQFAGGALLIPFSAKGCVSELKFMNLNGKKTDLSALGCDFTDWVNFKLIINRSAFTIQVEGNEQLTFPIDFTPVKFAGIGFTFQGTGAIDYLKISNHDGKVYYEDSF